LLLLLLLLLLKKGELGVDCCSFVVVVAGLGGGVAVSGYCGGRGAG
jgi:hypothetical protein